MWSVCRVHECFADVGVQGVLAGLEVCRLRVGGVRGVPVAGRRPSPTCSTASPLTVHTREGTFQIIDDQSSTLTRYTYQRALTKNTRTCLQFVFFISHNWLYKICCVINATFCSSSTLEEQEDLEGGETGRGPEWPGEAEINGDSSGNYN